ncbi:MAG TPA: site-2 protease family protein [Candidatus Binataceae bacterium]|jgi:regulator of sigma E protease
MLTSIISAIVILGLLIIVHEAGHFLVAKRLGVRVLRFSIGYPPRIAGFRRGETEYVIGATPAGGYVRMLGEEIGDEPKSDELHTFLVEIGHDLAQVTRETALTADTAPGAPQEGGAAAIDKPARAVDEGDRGADHGLDGLLESLASRPVPLEAQFSRPLKSEELILLNRIRMLNSARQARVSLQQNPPEELLAAFRARAFPSQPLWKRFAIVLAGPAANMLFAPVLLTLIFMYGVPTPLPVIDELTPGMPAVQAGLQSGDKIIAIDNKAISSWEEFSDAVKASKGAPLNLEIERPAGQPQGRMNLTVRAKRQDVKTPFGPVNEWIIGVTPREATRRLNPLAAAYHAVLSSVSLTGQMVVGIAMIVSGTVPIRESVGGPIAIVRLAGQEARHGLFSFAMFTVMLSLQLGLVNLLPVPLLDGGHLAFFAFEGVRGKPLAMRHREIALQVGLFLIVALFALLIFNDISHIVQG